MGMLQPPNPQLSHARINAAAHRWPRPNALAVQDDVLRLHAPLLHKPVVHRADVGKRLTGGGGTRAAAVARVVVPGYVCGGRGIMYAMSEPGAVGKGVQVRCRR
jgi:hypothetical protein